MRLDGKTIKDDADKKKVELYKEIALNQRDKEIYDEFKTWNENLSDTDKKNTAENVALIRYNAAVKKAEDKLIDNAKNSIANDMLNDIEEHITYESDGGALNVDLTSMTAEEQAIFHTIQDDYTDKVNAGENVPSFKDFFRSEFKETIKTATTDADVQNYIDNDEYGQKLKENYENEIKKLDEKRRAWLLKR